MNEGCSACACGVTGACDQLYFPGFLWPGVALLGLTLLVFVVLSRKKILKIRARTLLIGWLVLALAFAGIVYANTESQGDITREAADRCRTSKELACEY